jgi:hypothetical protein
MSTGYPPARTPAAPAVKAAVATIEAVSPGLDERWEAWQAMGEARDRAVRGKLAIAAPLAAIAAWLIFYALVIL